MSRKFPIFSTIFLEDIYKEIDEYIMCTGETQPYIFMSADTMRNMRMFLKPVITSNHKKSDATFYGYKVFVNDDLKFGIVEIR